jgi:hypothetical protein
MGKKRSTATASVTASTTGSKATAAAPKRSAPKVATAVAKDAQCDWTASTITKRDEKRMRSLGLIFDDEEDVRFPGSDSRPNPPPDSLLCFPLSCTGGCLFQPMSFFGVSCFHTVFSSGS